MPFPLEGVIVIVNWDVAHLEASNAWNVLTQKPELQVKNGHSLHRQHADPDHLPSKTGCQCHRIPAVPTVNQRYQNLL